MDNLRGLLGIRKTERVPNVLITELCGAPKRVDETIDKSVLRWFGHIERMGSDKIAKTVCVGESGGSFLVGQPQRCGLIQ